MVHNGYQENGTGKTTLMKTVLGLRQPLKGKIIHGDGLLKNEEIYNIFDTEKFLNRPVLCAVSNTSGLAGIAHWINTYYKLDEDKQVSKQSRLVKSIKELVDQEYDSGRVTVMTNRELDGMIKEQCKKLKIDLKEGLWKE